VRSHVRKGVKQTNILNKNVATSYLIMNRYFLATVMGAALLVTTGIVPMLFEGDYAAIGYPMNKRGDHGNGMMKPGDYAAGTIASIQNDESGNPSWILSGYWKASLIEGQAEEYGNQTSPSSNSTSAMGQDMANKVAKFGASIDMVMTNGSAMHQHKIDNFTLTGMSMPDNTTMVYNGTVTITMREGPVQDVPISATVMDGNVISLWLDPSRIENHFGDTPIYGTVTKAVKIMK
jgi:hypothetical protein